MGRLLEELGAPHITNASKDSENTLIIDHIARAVMRHPNEEAKNFLSDIKVRLGVFLRDIPLKI